MARVIHFEVHADQPETCDPVLLIRVRMEIGEVERDGGLLVGDNRARRTARHQRRLVRRRTPIDGRAVTAFVCTMQFDDLDQSVESAIAAGGSFAVEKMAIPGVGWLAYARDTEGNLFGLMQEDPKA